MPARIAGTTTAKGLTVICRLDRRSYNPQRPNNRAAKLAIFATP